MDGRAEPATGAPPVAAVPVHRVDFDRSLVCLLGLPFDAIDVNKAVERIRADAFAGRRCWVSTPNLNFAMAALSDTAFRDSVLRSDLSLIDGMPLVWIARLLGVPVPGRVAGSDLFEALQSHPGPPLDVYLFGGPPGAAPLACENMNRRGGGVRCVGFHEPGFGSTETMSSDETISGINRSNAHFVLVSLGAKKGQAWIERNAGRLTTPVLSHLGAVLNFSAGTVRRASPWLRKSGLEWLWRIKEEPTLWRRYGSDGIQAARLLFTRVLPDALDAARRLRGAVASAAVDLERSATGSTLRLHGAWLPGSEAPLREALRQCSSDDVRVTIDLSGVTTLAGTAAALLLQARGWFGTRGGFQVVGVHPALAMRLRRMLVDRALLDSMNDHRKSRVASAARPVSAEHADWSREAKRFWSWQPSRSLLACVRAYQRVRHCRRADRVVWRWLVVLRHCFWSTVAGADVPLNCRIEGGLQLPHPNGVVIHPDARIGPNCLLFQQVTVGQGGSIAGVPVLAGHVDVGAGAKILGGVTIGAHAVIGANAVVLCDVPSGATAVGVPARIVPPRTSFPDAEVEVKGG